MTRGKRGSIEPWLFLAPVLIGLVVFSLGPIVASFVLSFTSWDVLSAPTWVGLDNYREAGASDLFWRVLSNTGTYVALAVPASVAISLALAVLAAPKLRAIGFFRSVYFFPVACSMVGVAILWGWMFNGEFGILNALLKRIGVSGPAWLQDSAWAMVSLAAIGVWKSVGYNMMILIVAIQAIPPELEEAARLDGAPAWTRFRRITLPMLSHALFFVIVVSLIAAFQNFEQTYVLTRGGPANATLTLSYYIYQNAFQFFRMGYASAMAYVLCALVIAVTWLQFRQQRRWVVED